MEGIITWWLRAQSLELDSSLIFSSKILIYKTRTHKQHRMLIKNLTLWLAQGTQKNV